MPCHYPTVRCVAFKPEVRLTLASLDPVSIRMLQVAMQTAPPLVEDTMVVTSACDGEHSGHSLHFVSRAFDIRIQGPHRIGGIVVPPEYTGVALDEKLQLEARMWYSRMWQVLGSDYDVVLEGNHIHVEWDDHNRGA